jgi:hypothetical protein
VLAESCELIRCEVGAGVGGVSAWLTESRQLEDVWAGYLSGGVRGDEDHGACRIDRMEGWHSPIRGRLTRLGVQGSPALCRWFIALFRSHHPPVCKLCCQQRIQKPIPFRLPFEASFPKIDPAVPLPRIVEG